jgi:hypothetical protein
VTWLYQYISETNMNKIVSYILNKIVAFFYKKHLQLVSEEAVNSHYSLCCCLSSILVLLLILLVSLFSYCKLLLYSI